MIKQLCLFALLFTVAYTISIQQAVKDDIIKTGKTQAFIILKEHVDFRALEKTLHVELTAMDEKVRGELVHNSLLALATKSQKNIIKFLEERKIKYTPFWISNTISVTLDASLLNQLAKFTEIESIDKVDQAHIINPVANPVNFAKTSKRATIEDGIRWVKAPEVWAQGFKGQGITIGVIDTGVNPDHESLKKLYRGRDGDHKYSWLDGTSARRSAPYDDQGHGTHCHGTVTGASDDMVIGVAPEAEWISCKFLGARGGSYEDALKCLQFMLAPGGDSNMRPHVVSNSYGGGTPTAAMRRALASLMDSGVEMVFAAGNSGNRCGTVLLPGAYPEVFTVGALGRNSNTITRFSSRGPWSGARDVIKPEICAPGADVLSARHNNNSGYVRFSGTSMACPHVAGVVALLWNARPELKRNIAETRKVLQETATTLTSRWCPTTMTPVSPNNEYGYGGINVDKAVTFGKK